MAFVELIGDLLSPGMLNVMQGFGLEAGKPLASSNRVAKVASPARRRRDASSCSTLPRISFRSR